MRKSILAIGLALTILAAAPVTSFAQGEATVTFTADGDLAYGNVENAEGGVKLGDAFEGVAPGETRSQTILIQNNNSRTADFYMSAEAVAALERNAATARGAGYEMKLTAGDTVLYDSTVGGYGSGSEAAASTTGIENMNDALKDYILIATLAKGQSTNVVLSITFDGEAMDNTTAIDYSWTQGQLAFQFMVGYEDPADPTVTYKQVTKQGETKRVNKLVEILEEAVPLSVVATGDGAMIGLGVLILAAGVLLVVFGKRKKTEEES